jgi:hypothetical protein
MLIPDKLAPHSHLSTPDSGDMLREARFAAPFQSTGRARMERREIPP